MRTPKNAFTLLELVLVIAILGLLAGVVAPKLSQRLAVSRDDRRVAELLAVRDAIEQYKLDTGAYPVGRGNASYGGWDVSHDGEFLGVLVQAGYLSEMPRDPLNDANHHYRYFRYNSGAFGCVAPEPFFVLGIRNFETAGARHKHVGDFKCPLRDWTSEFAYVTGGGAAYD